MMAVFISGELDPGKYVVHSPDGTTRRATMNDLYRAIREEALRDALQAAVDCPKFGDGMDALHIYQVIERLIDQVEEGE